MAYSLLEEQWRKILIMEVDFQRLNSLYPLSACKIWTQSIQKLKSYFRKISILTYSVLKYCPLFSWCIRNLMSSMSIKKTVILCPINRTNSKRKCFTNYLLKIRFLTGIVIEIHCNVLLEEHLGKNPYRFISHFVFCFDTIRCQNFKCNLYFTQWIWKRNSGTSRKKGTEFLCSKFYLIRRIFN